MPKTGGGGNHNRLSRVPSCGTLSSVSKRKPLEIVRVVRARAVDDAARALREAEARAARARESEQAAKQREVAVRDEARTRSDAELAELARGASPRDLAQLAAFHVGNEQAIGRARLEANAAERARREEAERAERERRALIEARTSLDVVEKHQRTVAKRDEDAAAARLEEVAEDAHAARFSSRTGRSRT